MKSDAKLSPACVTAPSDRRSRSKDIVHVLRMKRYQRQDPATSLPTSSH